MSARLVRAARRVVEEWQANNSVSHDTLRELAAVMPRKRGTRTKSKAQRRAESGAADLAAFQKLPLANPAGPAQRDRVFRRDGYKCRHCGSTENLTMDHFFGRARDSHDDGCWTLCFECHLNQKTLNKPSRRYWLEEFRRHVAPISAERVCRVDALIAKDEGKRRASRPERETA